MIAMTITTIPVVIPPSTDGRVRLASTAVPGDSRSHGSDGGVGVLVYFDRHQGLAM